MLFYIWAVDKDDSEYSSYDTITNTSHMVKLENLFLLSPVGYCLLNCPIIFLGNNASTIPHCIFWPSFTICGFHIYK